MTNSHLRYTFINLNNQKDMENLLKEIVTEKVGMLQKNDQYGIIHPGMSWLDKEATNK